MNIRDAISHFGKAYLKFLGAIDKIGNVIPNVLDGISNFGKACLKFQNAIEKISAVYARTDANMVRTDCFSEKCGGMAVKIVSIARGMETAVAVFRTPFGHFGVAAEVVHKAVRHDFAL